MKPDKLTSDIIALRPFLIGVCRQMWRFNLSQEDAEDIAQDTLFRAIQNIDSFKPGTNLKAWVYSIAKNLVLSKMRHEYKTVFGKSLVRNLDCDASEIDVAGPELEQQSKVELDQTIEQLKKMNGKGQAALLYALGFTCDEIANFQKVDVGTVKSRISRTRFLLNKKRRGYSC